MKVGGRVQGMPSVKPKDPQVMFTQFRPGLFDYVIMPE